MARKRMSEDTMLQEAIQAARSGERARARDLLTRLLRTDQSNLEYWLWMSALVDSPTEQIYCLRSVLKLDPTHRVARRGLVILGGLPADDDVTPVPPLRKKRWVVSEIEGPHPTGLAAVFGNPYLRIPAVLILGTLVIGLILFGIFGMRARRARADQIAIIQQTALANPTATRTPTATVTRTPVFRTPTPTFARPTPLWMLLEATYTPTPLYVNTPHPITEAYRSGLRAYERADWTGVIRFMQQVIDIEGETPDILFQMGEAHRFLGQHNSALAAYNQALQLNNGFAPAYLGRALTRLSADPEAEVLDDLDEAIILDPSYGEAFLARASYFIQIEDPESALIDIAAAESILPTSPLVPLYRAQANLALGRFDEALESARLANEQDITLLPAYLALGQAFQGTGNLSSAFRALQTYTLYVEDDPIAWQSLGLTLAKLGDHPLAVEAFSRALDLDPQSPEVYMLRGSSYLALGEGELALDDYNTARRTQPDSFEVNLELGKALMQLGFHGDAYVHFNDILRLAEVDEQRADLYFWRAQSLEALDEPEAATRDWETLLALPEESFPAEWVSIAQTHILALNPPTATPTPLPSETPTITLTPVASQTPTPTPQGPQPINR